MDSYRFLWIPIDSYGFPWIPIDSYRFLSVPTYAYRFLWDPRTWKQMLPNGKQKMLNDKRMLSNDKRMLPNVGLTGDVRHSRGTLVAHGQRWVTHAKHTLWHLKCLPWEPRIV